MAWQIEFSPAADKALTKYGVLLKKSGFVDTDIVKLNRAVEALPQKEEKKLENR